MQGKKITQEKLLTTFQLSDHVLPDNFYRRLKQKLDLKFVRPLTKDFYRAEKGKPVRPAGGRKRH
jgi:hypothetical protein